MRLLFCIALAGVSLACFAQAATAHRIPEVDAKSRWYFVFNSHCGNGGPLQTAYHTCWNRKRRLSCRPVGPHTHNCLYGFREGGAFPWSRNRYCQIWGDLRHTTVVWWDESCT